MAPNIYISHSYTHIYLLWFSSVQMKMSVAKEHITVFKYILTL